jgi:hypothetical protein
MDSCLTCRMIQNEENSRSCEAWLVPRSLEFREAPELLDLSTSSVQQSALFVDFLALSNIQNSYHDTERGK